MSAGASAIPLAGNSARKGSHHTARNIAPPAIPSHIVLKLIVPIRLAAKK